MKNDEIFLYDDYNSRLARNHNIIGTVIPNFGSSALRNGWKVIVISRKQKAESRKQKAESRKQKAENSSNCGFNCQASTSKINSKLHYIERKSWNKQCNGNWKRSSSFSVIMDRRTIFRKTDIACTICARDYKGFGMTCMNGIIEVWESL